MKHRAVVAVGLACATTACRPTRLTPLGGAWIEEYRGPTFAEAGGTEYRLLRKRAWGSAVVDEFIARPRRYEDGDCVIYEQLNVQEIRIVCGEGRPRTLVAEENRFGGEMTSNWDLGESGLRRKGPGGAAIECISLSTARKVAGGGAVVVEPCAAATESPDARQPHR